jgi:hypothetical protein
MLLWAVALRCLDPVLTIACAMSYRPPWVIPLHPGERKATDKAKAALARGFRSDHLALLGAFTEFQAARRRGGGGHGSPAEYAFCRDNYVSAPTLNMVAAMRGQIADELTKAGLLNGFGGGPGGGRGRGGGGGGGAAALAAASVNGGDMRLVLAVLAAGAFPQVAQVRAGADRSPLIKLRDGAKASVAMGSVASSGVVDGGASGGGGRPRAPTALAGGIAGDAAWLVFDEMTKVRPAAGAGGRGQPRSRHVQPPPPPPPTARQTGSFGGVSVKQVSLVPSLAILSACGSRITWAVDEPDGDEEGEDDGDEAGAGAGAGGTEGVVTVDGWLPFRMTDSRAAAVMAVRHRLQAAFERVVRGEATSPVDDATIAAFRAAVSVDANV